MRLRTSAVIAVFTAFVAFSASAQKFQKTSAEGWITEWLGLQLVINTGGFGVSGGIDYVSEGTNGKHTYESISTVKGLAAVEDMEVELEKNKMLDGGPLTWEVITIDENDGDNMATSWGQPANMDNITWHGIIVIKSPKKKTTTGNFAHDDYAQVWVNGEKIYDNDQWTGAVKNTRPADVTLNKGDNVLLFKCGESGGSAYVNAHFEDSDADLDILPTTDGQFWRYTAFAVEPKDKLTTSWGWLKGYDGL